MAEITVARIVGDWRRVVGDEIVTHETPEIGDAGIHGTVTLTPVWPKNGPYGVIADPAAHYSIHPVVCRVRYGRLYDPTNTHPYEDVVVEIGGHPLVWSAKFDLTFRRRSGEPEVPLQVRGATFDSSAMVAGQVSLTGILPTSVVPGEYQSYFTDAAVSAGLADAARSGAELAAAAADVAAGVASAKADAAAASVGLAEAAADRAVGLSTAQDEHVADVLSDPDSATHAAFMAVGNATYGADAWEDPDSEVRQVAKTKFVGKAKSIRGAAMPEFQRRPTLGVEKVWPNTHEDVTPLWTSVDGNTIYAQDHAGYFLKSTDGGANWPTRHLLPAQPGGSYRRIGSKGAFLRLTDGTMLSWPRNDSAVTGIYIARSTDEGANWTWVDVSALMAGGYPLGPTSWCQDPLTGHVYYGEYDSSNTQSEVNVYRSTDSGATWTKFHTFPGPTTTHPDKVRHIHSVEWDHIAQRILITTGDPEPAAGIYRVNAAGTGVEPLLLNRQITNAYMHGAATPFTQSARAIGIMPFPDYIAYAADSPLAALVRVPRSALVTDGVTPVDVEVVKYLNSTAWFAVRAANDGSRWVVSASQEGTTMRLDPAAHLYAVEDQGATVYELGTWLSPSDSSWVSLSPVGDARHSGDTFYLRAHNSPRAATWKCSLLYSDGSPLPLPPAELRHAWVWETFSVPVTNLEPGASIVFGAQRVPSGASALSIYDMGVIRISGGYGLRARIQTPDGTIISETGAVSSRQQANIAPSQRRSLSRAPEPGTDVHYVMFNNSSTATSGTAYVTVGWGSLLGDITN